MFEVPGRIRGVKYSIMSTVHGPRHEVRPAFGRRATTGLLHSFPGPGRFPIPA